MEDNTNFKELIKRDPFKVEVMDIAEFIRIGRVPRITSSAIFEPNSTRFHPEGLFSEEIFGKITDLTRFTTIASIKLNTRIIHPVIYASIIKKKKMYVGILSGTRYAVFDEKAHAFELADQDTKDAGTGFAFFMKYLPELYKAEQPKALRSRNIHALMVKYKDSLTTSDFLVLPAGLRDIDVKSNRLAQDDINKIYLGIINLSAGLSEHALSSDSMFDGIRMKIQTRIDDLYQYINDTISEKKGFLQRHYGARKITFGTRNVISVSTTNSNVPDSPVAMKSNETMVPLLNTIKAFQPFFVNYIKNRLYGELFKHGESSKVAVTNPKTMSIEYTTMSPKEMKRYTHPKHIAQLINKFAYRGFRESPVSIIGDKNKVYWLILTYKIHGKVFVGKTVDDLKGIVEKHGDVFAPESITPMTWSEAMYIASIDITKDKHGFVARYPVIEDGSIYPSKVHVITTTPDKQCDVIFDDGSTIRAIHYPILGNAYYESLIVHGSRLTQLGADYDGDMTAFSGVWTEDGNAEIAENLASIGAVVNDNMRLKIRADTDIIDLIVHNLSKG